MSGGIGPQERENRSGLFCKQGQVPKFHILFSHFQNIDSFLQTGLSELLSDEGLGSIPCGIFEMLFAVGFPIIRALSSPVSLGLPVIVSILFLPALLAMPFLFPFAVFTAAGFLTTSQTMIGRKPDGTPDTLPLPEYFHEEEIG